MATGNTVTDCRITFARCMAYSLSSGNMMLKSSSERCYRQQAQEFKRKGATGNMHDEDDDC